MKNRDQCELVQLRKKRIRAEKTGIHTEGMSKKTQVDLWAQKIVKNRPIFPLRRKKFSLENH